MFSLCFKVVLSFLFVVIVFAEESPSGQDDNGGNEGDITNGNPAESANEEDDNAEASLNERQTRGIRAGIRNGKIKVGIFQKIRCEGLVPRRHKVRRGVDYSKTLGLFTELKCTGLEHFLSGHFYRDCKDIKNRRRFSRSGLYTVYARGIRMKVYCDMKTDGGGWTVIQRRMDSTSFQQTWNEYKKGFGNLKRSFWLGNDKIHNLTNSGKYELRIDMRDRLGYVRYAKYRSFRISNEAGKYRLYLGSLGIHNVGYNAMAYHNGQLFSTRDRDYDRNGGSCSGSYSKGGWWYSSCYRANLNGIYRSFSNSGIKWYGMVSTKKRWSDLIHCEMKIRPA